MPVYVSSFADSTEVAVLLLNSDVANFYLGLLNQVRDLSRDNRDVEFLRVNISTGVNISTQLIDGAQRNDLHIANFVYVDFMEIVMGGYRDLFPGEWEELTPDEISIFQARKSDMISSELWSVAADITAFNNAFNNDGGAGVRWIFYNEYFTNETPWISDSVFENAAGRIEWPIEMIPALQLAGIFMHRVCGSRLELHPSQIKKVGNRLTISISVPCDMRHWSHGLEELYAAVDAGAPLNVEQDSRTGRINIWDTNAKISMGWLPPTG